MLIAEPMYASVAEAEGEINLSGWLFEMYIL